MEFGKDLFELLKALDPSQQTFAGMVCVALGWAVAKFLPRRRLP